MDKKTAIEKIRKCLALAKSSEPHEAAAALRQAQKLMEKFGIDHPEILASTISEDFVKSSASKIPARYEVHLAVVICEVFGCQMIFCRRLSRSRMAIEGGYSFIAAAPIPEIATYTFAVLRRQLTKARANYIATALKRHRKNKTAAADMFCVGWVEAVHNQIQQLSPTPEQEEAIAAYMKANHAKLLPLKERERKVSGTSGHNHLWNGFAEGKKVTLNRGVGNQEQSLIGA
ncbi:DUF2786 domain-containing protein [Undibacterium danionis]|uniref:DUF2786 domain-containing protein n=1 Tax=Undibacterium danionis TaxID=1812100 RepID=A0ABV6ID27_9BURK